MRLCSCECAICRDQRTDLFAAPPPAPLTACAACSGVIEPCTAAIIRARAPNALCKEPNVAAEPLPSLLEKLGCAALPSVNAPADSFFYLPIANPSNSRVEIAAGTPVVALAPFPLAPNSPSTAATSPQLSRDEKLRKVLRELQFDALPDSTPHKRPLVSLVCKYLDIFAESDADVGTTSLAFHEIDTNDTRPLREPVRRLPYGEVREAVAKEIEKLTNAGIARPSTSPWASPVVMVRKKDGGWRMYVDYRRLNFDEVRLFPAPAPRRSARRYRWCHCLVVVRSRDGIPSSACKARLRIKDGVHHECRLVRDGEDAIRALQRAVYVPALDDERAAGLDRSQLPRVFRQYNLLLEAPCREREQFKSCSRPHSRRWSQSEAREVQANLRASAVSRARHFRCWCVARSSDTARTF